MADYRESITDDAVEQIVEYAVSMNPDFSKRIEWEDFLLDVEQVLDCDLPVSYSDPIIKRIKREVAKARRE